MTDMYDVMRKISDGTLQAGADSGWDDCFQGNLGELYWIFGQEIIPWSSAHSKPVSLYFKESLGSRYFCGLTKLGGV